MFWANFWGNDVAVAPAQCNIHGECGIGHAEIAEPIELSFGMVSRVLDGHAQWCHLAYMVERLCNAAIVSQQGWRRGLYPNYLGPSGFCLMQTVHLQGCISVHSAHPSNTLYLPSKMTAWLVQPFLHGQWHILYIGPMLHCAGAAGQFPQKFGL